MIFKKKKRISLRRKKEFLIVVWNPERTDVREPAKEVKKTAMFPFVDILCLN